MLALLLAAATPATAVDAERAFAAQALTDGQWTAFRAWAAPDAVMFVPQPSNAQVFLKPLKDPAEPIRWSPTASYVSCDGQVAVNTGEWRQPDGSVGFFSTVWMRQPEGGWKWVVDGGDALATPRARVAEPEVERATCAALAPALRPAPMPGTTVGEGHSPDWTLTWRYEVEKTGARRFEASIYDTDHYRPVINDVIPPPPAPAKP